VIEEGKETDLEHGSGIGLWLVEWGATALGGDVSYETGPEGTTATVELPGMIVSKGANGKQSYTADD
jgi:signal transduction histidine kinase